MLYLRSFNRFILISLALMGLSISSANAIVYNVDRTIGAGTVTGFIETDGTLGVLASINITDWVVTLSVPDLIGGSPEVLDFATSTQFPILGGATSATDTQLIFDFDFAGNAFFALEAPVTKNFWCLSNNSSCYGSGDAEWMGHVPPGTRGAETALGSGAVVFAEVSAVPVPAAVWLFGTALIGFIGISRRRKVA